MSDNGGLSQNAFEPNHEFLIGVDSDGCVFNTMEAKQKKCFTPNTITFFGLESVSEFARDASEFVGLYSKWRGLNRFPGLVKTLDFLKERLVLEGREAALPDLTPLREWIRRESRLGNPALEIEVESISLANIDTIGQAFLVDEEFCLAHLFATDVDPRDMAAVRVGDADGWGTDPAPDVEDTLGVAKPRHLDDHVCVGVERIV